jgi:protein TonB
MQRVILTALLVSTLGCMDENDAQKAVEAIWQGGPRPDSMPVMLNRELPFRYPLELWNTKVQGNVVLRIHIDSIGNVVDDSTRVVQSSGYPSLDSAAVRGSQELLFRPALLRGKPLALSIQLPVYFRHPDAAPLPGDTILRRDSGLGTQDSTKRPQPRP